jgi:hypothetical protein
MDGDGEAREAYATLEDISAHGACLQVEDPIQESVPITILYPSGEYIGKVKYCFFQLTGYFVGVEFASGYQWSQKQYNPSHLLRLRLQKPEDS